MSADATAGIGDSSATAVDGVSAADAAAMGDAAAADAAAAAADGGGGGAGGGSKIVCTAMCKAYGFRLVSASNSGLNTQPSILPKHMRVAIIASSVRW